jgi:ubiquinone/menaquinone biosynthesis C-methylase UbiE
MIKEARYGFYGLPVIGTLSGVLIIGGIFAAIFYARIPGVLASALGLYILVSYFVSMFIMDRKTRKRPADISRFLRINGHENVLDVGCGLGRMSIQVAKHLNEGKVIGIDIWDKKKILRNSPELAYSNAEAEGVKDRVEFRSGSVLRLEFPDNSFDAVTCRNVLNDMDKDKKFKALREIRRVLKPGGRLLLIEPLREPYMFFLMSPIFYLKLTKKGHWLGLMDQVGFLSLRYTPWQGFGIFTSKKPQR